MSCERTRTCWVSWGLEKFPLEVRQTDLCTCPQVGFSCNTLINTIFKAWLTYEKVKIGTTFIGEQHYHQVFTNTSIAADLSSIASNHLIASLDWKNTTLLFVKTLYLSQLLLSCFNFLHVFMEYHHSRWDSYHASLVVQKSSIHLFQHLFTEVLSFKYPSFKKIPN